MYFTQTLDWTLLLPYRGNVREKVLSKKVHFCCCVWHLSGVRSIFLVTVMSQDDLWSMLKEMEDVVINLRRHHTSRFVIGSDLNVSLAPSLEGLTGSRIHSNANGASSRWREGVTEWMNSFVYGLCAPSITASLSLVWNGIMIPVGRTETLIRVASFSWITCLSLSMCMVRPVWCGVATI